MIFNKKHMCNIQIYEMQRVLSQDAGKEERYVKWDMGTEIGYCFVEFTEYVAVGLVIMWHIYS